MRKLLLCGVLMTYSMLSKAELICYSLDGAQETTWSTNTTYVPIYVNPMPEGGIACIASGNELQFIQAHFQGLHQGPSRGVKVEGQPATIWYGDDALFVNGNL